MKRLAWIGMCGAAAVLSFANGCGDSGTDGGGSGGTSSSSSASGTSTKSSSSGSQTASVSNTASSTTDTSASSSEVASSSTGLENCTAVTWTYSKTVTSNGAAAIRGILAPNIGEPQNDLLEFDFYADTTGVIDLAAGTNPEWNTCLQCAWVQQDAIGNVVNYMPLSGAMTIDATSTPTTGDVTFEVTDATLIEVTIDEVAQTTTPVPGGRCLTLATATYTP